MSADEAVQKANKRRRNRRGSEPDHDDAEMLEEAEDYDDEGEGPANALTERKGRATPGRRARKTTKQEESGNAITRPFRGMIDYFQGVKDELDKVVWPTREEMIRLTRIVLMVTIASALALGAIAFFFTELFILGFDNEWVFAVFFGAVAVITFGVMRYTARRNRLKTTL